MSLLKSSWRMFASELWQKEAIEKLDEHVTNEAANPHNQYLLESDALAVFAFAAYGGLLLDTPTPFSDLGPTYQVIDIFDEIVPSVPRGVAAELSPTWSLAFLYDGVYIFSFNGTFEHNSSNQGRLTYIQIWNVTDGVPIGAPLVVATGRNAEATVINLLVLAEITESLKNKKIQLQIGGGDTYTAVQFDAIQFQAWNVGEWREPLPSE